MTKENHPTIQVNFHVGTVIIGDAGKITPQEKEPKQKKRSRTKWFLSLIGVYSLAAKILEFCDRFNK